MFLVTKHHQQQQQQGERHQTIRAENISPSKMAAEVIDDSSSQRMSRTARRSRRYISQTTAPTSQQQPTYYIEKVDSIVVDEDENDLVDEVVTVGENVKISKFPSEGAATAPATIPGFGCASKCTDDADVVPGGSKQRRILIQQSTERIKRHSEVGITASSLMCGAACQSLAPSPKHAPYNLAMVYSSETNAGDLLMQKTPRRKRYSSNVRNSLTSGDNGTVESSLDRTATLKHASSIPFNTTTTSLVSVTMMGRRSSATTKPKVEKFDYAKALLRSDEELTKLSRRIRTEINESELFELALAAERAAEMGQEKFEGKASTFGVTHSTTGESQSSDEELPAPSTTVNSINRALTVSKTAKSLPLAIPKPEPISPSRAMTISFPVAKAIQTPPQDTVTTPTLSSSVMRGPSAGGLRSSFSERSLLEVVAVVTTPPRPEKRSMGIDSLRDVNEVIPHWKELHEQMRTHLYREAVNKNTLFFHPSTENGSNNQNHEESKQSSKLDGDHSSMTDLGAPGLCSSPRHRRSLSLFDEIADMTIPGFGQKRNLEQQKARLTTSKDQSNNTASTDDATQASVSERSTTSVGRFGNTLSSHLSPKKYDRTRWPSLKVPSGLDDPQSPPPATKPDEIPRLEQPFSLTARLPRKPQAFDLGDLKMAMEAERRTLPRNRSACSSETTSVVSSDDLLDADEDDDIDEDKAKSESTVFLVDQHSKAEPLRQSPVPTKTSNVETPIRDDASPHIVSLMDDEVSVSPVSPAQQTSLETSTVNTFHHTPTKPTQNEVPLTPKEDATASKADLGFNTPAHLRRIKKSNRKSHEQRHFIDAPPPPILQKQTVEEVISTPAINFPSPFEPNSIVENSPEPTKEDRFPTRSSLPYLQENETRFLALPTIQSSTSEQGMEINNSRRITRRTINRTHWSKRSDDSPTTPTDPLARMFLNPTKAQQEFLSKSTSFPDCTPTRLYKESIFGASSTLDESSQSVEIGTSRTSDNGPMSVAMPKATTIPKRTEHTDSVVRVGAYNEEKKEGDAAEIESKTLSSGNELKHEENTIETPETPRQSTYTVPLSSPSSQTKSDHEGGRVHPSIIKSLSAPDYPPSEESSGIFASSKTVKSAPDTVEDSNFVIPLIKRTETWDGVVSIDTSPLDAVHSFINTTTSAVNDAASFLADMATGDSKDYSVAKSSESMHGDVGGCSALVGHRRHFSSGHPRYPLCHSEDNFKAAVQGVLSQLSLSPKSRQQIQDERSVFLSEAENKEFLRNYFYCTKKDDDQKSTKSTRNEVEEETEQHTTIHFGDGIACSVAEPCQNQDAQCHLFGADAVCGGFTYFFFNNNIDDSTSSQCASKNADSTNKNFNKQSSSRSLSSRRRFSSPPDFHTTKSPLIDWQYQHQQYNNNNGQESWMGMFQRVASKRFSFTADSDLERSKHPFTPPCLTRRVIPSTTTTTTKETTNQDKSSRR